MFSLLFPAMKTLSLTAEMNTSIHTKMRIIDCGRAYTQIQHHANCPPTLPLTLFYFYSPYFSSSSDSPTYFFYLFWKLPQTYFDMKLSYECINKTKMNEK